MKKSIKSFKRLLILPATASIFSIAISCENKDEKEVKRIPLTPINPAFEYKKYIENQKELLIKDLKIEELNNIQIKSKILNFINDFLIEKISKIDIDNDINKLKNKAKTYLNLVEEYQEIKALLVKTNDAKNEYKKCDSAIQKLNELEQDINSSIANFENDFITRQYSFMPIKQLFTQKMEEAKNIYEAWLKTQNIENDTWKPEALQPTDRYLELPKNIDNSYQEITSYLAINKKTYGNYGGYIDWAKVNNKNIDNRSKSLFNDHYRGIDQFYPKRTSKIGDKRAEIEELKNLMTLLMQNRNYNAFNLEGLRFNNRNMSEAFLEWSNESWPDYFYVDQTTKRMKFGIELDKSIHHQATLSYYEDQYKDTYMELYSMEKHSLNFIDKVIYQWIAKTNLLKNAALALREIKENMSDIDKVYTIMRFVGDLFDYDLSALNNNVADVFEDYKAVCQQYSTFASWLFNLVGIPSVSIIGQPGTFDLHQFPLVKVKVENNGDAEAKWYVADPTSYDARSEKDYTDPTAYDQDRENAGIRRAGYILRKVGDGPFLEENSITYPGTAINYQLPIDHLWKNASISTKSFIETNNMFRDNKFDYQGKKYYIKKSSRRWFFNNYWYQFVNFSNNKKGNYKGLIRMKIDSNKVDFVLSNLGDYDSNDLLAKRFKELYTIDSILDKADGNPLSFNYQNLLFYSTFSQNAGVIEPTLNILDLNNLSDNKTINLAQIFKNEFKENYNNKINFLVNFYIRHNKLYLHFNGKNKLVYDLDLQNNKELLSIKNKDHYSFQDLINELAITRANLGTYIFSPKEFNQAVIPYTLPYSIRQEFLNIKEEIKQNKTLTQSQIDSYITKLKNLRKDLVTKIYVPNKTKPKVLVDLPTHIFKSWNNYNNYNIKLNFATLNEYSIINNETLQNSIRYDFYFSKTKPEMNELNNEKYLISQEQEFSKFYLNKKILSDPNGYLWVKAYNVNVGKDKYIFSNVCHIVVNDNVPEVVWVASPNWNARSTNLLNSEAESKKSFDSIKEVSMEVSIQNLNLISNPKLKIYRFYKGQKELVEERNLTLKENSNIIKYSLDPQHKKWGKYDFVLEYEYNGKIIKLPANQAFMNIDITDSINFEFDDYFE